MLIVSIASISNSYDSGIEVTITIFYLFFVISYFWGLIFGGLLLCKVRSMPLHLRMPLPLTTEVHHVAVHQYQPLPQKPQQYAMQPPQQYYQ